MVKKKVLFLYNGGTIGMLLEERDCGPVLIPPKDKNTFKDACKPIVNRFSDVIDVTFEVITTKDSTNMNPNDWEKLALRIWKAQKEGFDAVAIAHGTDTLAYTANALAFALHGRNPNNSCLKIPVCITGSQTPIYEKGGDGRFNLENVFRVLIKCIELGVSDILINFWDRVLLGCRALKISERDFDAFRTPAYPNVGFIDASGVHLNLKLLRKAKDAGGTEVPLAKFARGVVTFELSPGLDPNILLQMISSGGVSAVVLKSLGEGNVCNEGQYNLLPAVRQATNEYFTPIFITTKFVGGTVSSTFYEVGYAALKAGAIPCYDQTDVTVEVKVRWLLGNGICSKIEDFSKAMETNYVGEVTPQE